MFLVSLWVFISASESWSLIGKPQLIFFSSQIMPTSQSVNLFCFLFTLSLLFFFLVVVSVPRNTYMLFCLSYHQSALVLSYAHPAPRHYVKDFPNFFDCWGLFSRPFLRKGVLSIYLWYSYFKDSGESETYPLLLLIIQRIGHLGETWRSLERHMNKRNHFSYKTFPFYTLLII